MWMNLYSKVNNDEVFHILLRVAACAWISREIGHLQIHRL